MIEEDRDLGDRYGERSRAGRRRLVTIAVGALALVFLGWVGWVTWFHGNPVVTSELQSFEVTSQHEATARVRVHLDEEALGDGEAQCLLRALAEDHAVVGELSFTPHEGVNDVTIRTERLAVSVDPIGCTAPGQNRSR